MPDMSVRYATCAAAGVGRCLLDESDTTTASFDQPTTPHLRLALGQQHNSIYAWVLHTKPDTAATSNGSSQQ